MTNPAIGEQMEQLSLQLDRIQRMKQTTDARFAKLDGMRERIAAVEASVTSSDKAVTVVAGPGGSVKSIRFAEEARKLSPTQLSERATSTLQQAVAQAARNQAEVIQEHVGDDMDIVGRVMQTQEHALAGTTLGQDQPSHASQSDAPADAPSVATQRETGPRHAAPPPEPVDDSAYDESLDSLFDSEGIDSAGVGAHPAPSPQPPQRSAEQDHGYLRLYGEEDGW